MATTPQLRPLSVGEILDVGIKLYLRHWKTLMVCVIGIVLPLQILTALLLSSVDSNTFTYNFDANAGSSSSEVDWGPLGALFAIEIVVVLSWLLATAACFKAVSDAYLGAPPEAGRSLRFAAKRLPALVAMLIVGWIVLSLAAIALIVPAIWLAVSFMLAVPALLFERIGPVKALRRSFRLVRKRWWPTLGTFVVGYILVGIISVIVQLVPSGLVAVIAPDSSLADGVASVVGGTIASAISMPYLAAILTLLYFDQRVRKEGFDLQLLAEGLGLGRERDANAPLPQPLIGPDVTPEQRAAAPFWPPPAGWKPPPPAPAPAAERQWWRDPEPSTRYPGGEGGGFAPPAPPDDAPKDERPEAPRAPKPDSDRADWLPPEAPRGPGGL